jgi:hypothetical protein
MGLFEITKDDLVSLKPIEPTWYPFEITRMADEPSSNGPFTNCVVSFRGLAGAAKGVTVKKYFPIKADSIWAVVPFLIACGEEMPEEGGTFNLTEEVFKGKQLLIKIKHEQFGGETRNAVDRFKKLEAPVAATA